MNKYSKVILLLGLVLPIGYSALTVAFIPPYVYYPDYATMGQLYWIGDSFGFSNHSTIVLVYQTPAGPIEPGFDVNLHDWIRATVGDEVYHGHLLQLVNGQPDAYGNVFDFHNKSIVIASTLYRITALEKTLAQRITEGIYLIKNTTLEATLQAMVSLSTFNDSSFSNWQAVNTTISTNVSKTSNGLEVMFKGPTYNERINLVVSRNISSYGLVLNSTSTVFLRTWSYLGSVGTILGFVYHDLQNNSLHHVSEYDLGSTISGYFAWHIVPIHYEMPIDTIYLRFINWTNSIPTVQAITMQSVFIL